MTETEVVELMESSQTEGEWNANADKVKTACGGYPNFWFGAVIQSGLLKRVAPRWGSDGEMRVVPITFDN